MNIYTKNNTSSPYFLCGWADEIVILSDGRITTCCHDVKGDNVYADINTDSFYQVFAKYRCMRESLAVTPEIFPRCRQCFKQYRDGENKFYRFNKIQTRDKSRFNTYITHKPVNMVMEPASQCNLKCIGCINGKGGLKAHRRSEFLDLGYAFRWLENDLNQLDAIRFYNHGEPLLNPGAIEFCSTVKRLKPMMISIATNGMPLSNRRKREALVRSGVDHIDFSIHGSCQASTEIYMTPAFSFKKTMEILEDLVKLKKKHDSTTPLLEWKYLLFEWNDTDLHITRAKEFATKIGIDSVLFALTTSPSPSKRFTQGSEDWRLLTRNMDSMWDFGFSWQVPPRQGI